MKKKKSKIEVAFDLFVLSLFFIGVVSTVHDWLYGSLS